MITRERGDSGQARGNEEREKREDLERERKQREDRDGEKRERDKRELRWQFEEEEELTTYFCLLFNFLKALRYSSNT